MTKYIPTDAAIRQTYLSALQSSIPYGFADLYEEEFDRWLAAHDRQVAAKAVAGIREAWLNPGIAPAVHYRAQERLSLQWPTLSNAIIHAVSLVPGNPEPTDQTGDNRG